MIISIPRDLECYAEYQRLLTALDDEVQTSFIVSQLWTTLAYQAQLHDISGQIQAKDLERFTQRVTRQLAKRWLPIVYGDPRILAPEKLTEILLTTGVLAKRGDDFFCATFSDCNKSLSKNYISPSRLGQTACAVKKIKGAADRAVPLIFDQLQQLMPESAWCGAEAPDRSRSLVLIFIVDRICRAPQRDVAGYELGLIADACRIVKSNTDEQLRTILMRMHMVRSQAKLPRNPAEILRRWDDLLTEIQPPDGFVDWSKRSKTEGAAVIAQ